MALDNIINVGELEVEGAAKGVLNKYALACDMEAVDKIGSLIFAIKENPNPGDYGVNPPNTWSRGGRCVEVE